MDTLQTESVQTFNERQLQGNEFDFLKLLLSKAPGKADVLKDVKTQSRNTLLRPFWGVYTIQLYMFLWRNKRTMHIDIPFICSYTDEQDKGQSLKQQAICSRPPSQFFYENKT